MTVKTSDYLILGSSLVSFLPGVSEQDRADILDVLLLAELSASGQYDRHKQWEAWIAAYQAALNESGLTAQGSLAPKPVKVRSQRRFRREAAKLVMTINPQQLAVLAQSALDQMFSSAHAQSFFKHWFGFNAGRSDSFQVIPCQQATSGVINIAVCGLEMVTRTRTNLPLIGILQNPFRYEMTLSLRGAGFIFNREIHAQYRARVQKQLQDMNREVLELISL